MGLTSVIYWPGMRGGFVFDDSPNIIENEALALEEFSAAALWSAAFSSNAGPLKRPLANVSFALNRYIGGLDPFYYKTVNLGIHLLVGAMLFVLLLLLGNALLEDQRWLTSTTVWWLAACTTGLWLVHPLNLTSVLYIVQRMTSFAALFTVAGLIVYVYSRTRIANAALGLGLALLGLFTGGVLASFSKETGVLIFVYALVIEITLLRFRGLCDGRGQVLKRLYIGLVTLGALLGTLAIWYAWDWLMSPYVFREFSLAERLLTQSRVLLFYVYQIFIPNVTTLALFHDDFVLSRSFTSPISTLFATVSIAALVTLALMNRRSWPLLSFAVLWFFGGHIMESTFLPLELVHEHRNYVPMVGPLYALTLGVLKPWDVKLDKRLFIYALGAFAVFLAVQTHARATQWSNPLLHAAYELARHPDSYRAVYAMGRLELYYADDPDVYERALDHFKRAAALQPFRQKALFSAIHTHYLSGGDPPRHLFDELLARLIRYPFLPGEVNDVKALMTCQEQNICRLEATDMQAIFDAAIGSPKTLSDTRAVLWNLRARYAAQELDDWDLAETYVLNAVSLDPKAVYYRINLAYVYLATGQLADAEEQLQVARGNDQLGIHSRALETLDEQIRTIKGVL